MRALLATVLIATLPAVASNFSDEPSYCAPAEFYKHEVKNQYTKVKRVHAFKLGDVTLVGLAVGNSKFVDVKKMSEEIGHVSASDLYCTWYLNEGNRDAERYFRHIYVPNPRTLSEKEAYDVYAQKLGGEFGANALSFVSCIEKNNFAALGCDGMKHRGPTVFGMLLSYSGCSPEHSLEIVNKLWDLNGIPPSHRLAAIKAGYDLGNQEPAGRQALQDKLSK